MRYFLTILPLIFLFTNNKCSFLFLLGGHHQISSHNQHQPDNNNNNNRRNKSGKRLPEIPELYSQHSEQYSRNEKLLANALSVLSESMERRQQAEPRNKKGPNNGGGSGSSSSKDYGNDNR